MTIEDLKRAARRREKTRQQEAILRKRHFPTPKEHLKSDEKNLAEKRKMLEVCRKSLTESLATVKRLTEITIPKLQLMVPALEADVAGLSKRLKREKPRIETIAKIDRLKAEIARMQREVNRL